MQNESTFVNPGWIPWSQICAQLEALWSAHAIDYCKIGLVESVECLAHIVQWLRQKNPAMFILWDPILKASAGFDFHSSAQRVAFVDITRQLSLITPNQLEYEWLGADIACPVLLKGGHQSGDYCVDRLLWRGTVLAEFSQTRLQKVRKHGTGCVLSASVVALMAQGLALPEACRLSRDFLQNYLQSAPGLPGCVFASLPTHPEKGHALTEITNERLYVITWDEAGRTQVEQVQSLCEHGVRLVQLRMKVGSKEERLQMAWQALRICRQWGCLLVINDDVELARAVRAGAVQALIGGTANTPEQVAQRISEGADYVGLGPWRFTGTKKNLSPVLGADGVALAMALVKQLKPGFPVFVIGGVLPNDCKEIMELGACGVAVSSTIVADKDPQKKIQEFRRALVGQGVHP